MDIFEGTEQIQRLVISRAISGLRIGSSVRSLGHDAVAVALEVPVERGLVEVHETIPIGAVVELACEEHHRDVA